MVDRTAEQRAARADYVRRRNEAIKAGTWNPRRSREPTITNPTAEQIAWAAGFLEGEGCFRNGADHVRVRADQLNWEPLEQLLLLFGGGLSQRGALTSAGNVVWRWYCASRHARRTMELVRPYMSANKRRDIDIALATPLPKPRGWANSQKTHCPQGHPYDEANTIIDRKPEGRTGRKCKSCYRIYRRGLAERKRAAKH